MGILFHKSLSIFLLFFSLKSFSQIKHVEILLGKSNIQVENYFDSLNLILGNSGNKIKKDVDSNGDITIANDITIEDEEFYKCFLIISTFHRTDKGEEMCIKQGVMGRSKFAEPNLSFIKDNFKPISEGVWEKPFSDYLPKVKIVASFERKNSDYPTYIITYQLKFED